MAPLNRSGENKRKMMLAAAERWQARSESRSLDAATVRTGGPGTADSPMRQARFAAREAILTQAAGMRERGQLPFFIERKIGPTLDFLSLAPSEAARKAGRPVARIVNTVDPRLTPDGFATGFLVAPRLLMTNWHVFPDVSAAARTGANFLHEQDERGTESGITFEIDPDAFFVADEALDFAIVGLKERAVTGEPLSDFVPIALIEATPKILIGQKIDLVEFPGGAEKKYVTQNNRLLDILDAGFLHYEADTDEGSSGSPAFSESWELVALHHASIPEVRDGQIIDVDGGVWVDGMNDDRIHWVANEGIRISAIVASLAKKQLANPAQAKLLSDLLANTTDPVDDITQFVATGAVPEARGTPPGAAEPSRQPAPPRQEIGMAGITFNFSGPVTIHVNSPALVQPGAPATPSPPLGAPEKTLRFDPNYEDREGYDDDFLGNGLPVPLPRVSEARDNEMYKENGQIVVLNYHHYSLAMNRKRRLQMWSAVNVSYDPTLRTTSGRAFFGTDRWIGDPRIPAACQIADPDIYAPAQQIDRGHIVRREDSAWGESAQETEFANADTFHWTNCTPQHAAFNRETPGGRYGATRGLWGGFEAYIQKSLQHGDPKACILAGPVLAEDDPTADFGTGPIQYPIQFWKVVAVAVQDPGGRSSVRAYGFVLSQKDVVDQFGIEFAPGQFARFQRSLPDISALTGIIFTDELLTADRKAANA